MPEFQLTDSILTQLNAQEPWPDNVKLFQPYEVEQILLPDNASCLAVQAFLKMCNLPFEVEMRWNAEFMSPSGRVPFIKCGAFVVSELEPIVQFAANKGVTLCGRLSTEEKAEMRAYMSLITNVLVNAELYISWVDNDTFNAVTKVRNASVYPWPLGWLQTRAKRNAVIKRLKALHWYEKTLDQVLADVEQCCNSLSQRLADRDYFFGNSPTCLDARVYGHVRALLSAQGPKAALMIKPLTSSLLRHMLRITNYTDMKMTPQEEYLLYQAFRLMGPRNPAERSVSERNTRTRSRLSVKNASRDSIHNRERDMFGFKPFASKQIIIMTSKEGAITCMPHSDQELRSSMEEICREILHKVDELISNDCLEHIDVKCKKNDIEIIESPKDNIDAKVNDYTIEEKNPCDNRVLGDSDDDIICHSQDEEFHDIVICERNTARSPPLSPHPSLSSPPSVISPRAPPTCPSSPPPSPLASSSPPSSPSPSIYERKSKRPLSPCKELDSSITSSSSCKPPEIESELNDEEMANWNILTSNVANNNIQGSTISSKGSIDTLTMPSNEDISVESLLKYIRRKNSHSIIADID